MFELCSCVVHFVIPVVVFTVFYRTNRAVKTKTDVGGLVVTITILNNVYIIPQPASQGQQLHQSFSAEELRSLPVPRNSVDLQNEVSVNKALHLRFENSYTGLLPTIVEVLIQQQCFGATGCM